MPSVDDRTISLVQAAQGGDETALSQLMERYQERVHWVVRTRMGAKLRSVAESVDIVQEAFVVALRTFDRFEMRDEASFLNWLSKLAENQIHALAHRWNTQKRDQQRVMRLETSPPDLPTEELRIQVAAETTLPPGKASKLEMQKLVAESLQELPEELRELILLRDFLGASWETVARECQRPSPEAARMMHARAVAELSKLVRKRS